MMLSNKEKKEMLEDANNTERRAQFRFGKSKNRGLDSIDEYLLFLNSVQRVFAPIKIFKQPAPTEKNRL
ncbi:hypothetical protein ACFL1I_02045 [Candidatus Omnitrophota bacterium]